MCLQVKTSLHYFDFDDLSLDDVIGRGIFTVFRGKMAGKVVAVKKMDCDKNEIPREVEIQNNLPPHPNIIPLLGVTHSPDGFSVYSCTELADKSLYQYLHTEKKKPSLQQSTNWAMQIARAMQHIHQHGVAHRDLKSASILLFEKEDILKLSSFGCAQELERTTTMTWAIGTPRWMAPEFNDRVDAKINQRCDVFSYGMVLYEIFAHEVPFSDLLDSYEAMLAIKKGERPPIPPEAPLYIQQLMRSCWEHDPHDRPTFEQILQVSYSDTPMAYSIQYVWLTAMQQQRGRKRGGRGASCPPPPHTHLLRRGAMLSPLFAN